jgi:hypothetical protein
MKLREIKRKQTEKLEFKKIMKDLRNSEKYDSMQESHIENTKPGTKESFVKETNDSPLTSP